MHTKQQIPSDQLAREEPGVQAGVATITEIITEITERLQRSTAATKERVHPQASS
jgi:hypothetical protein